MSFHVGQKVTLRDDRPWEDAAGRPVSDSAVPVFGAVHVIRRQTMWCGQEFLIFAEFAPYGFPACHFRPVVEPKTDITRMLDPVRVPEPVIRRCLAIDARDIFDCVA